MESRKWTGESELNYYQTDKPSTRRAVSLGTKKILYKPGVWTPSQASSSARGAL